MDKYQQLRDVGTNGDNYDLSTDDLIEQFQYWDTQYGIELSEVEFDAVTVIFKELPEDLNELAIEIYEFCPDTIDQHFGCFAEAIAVMEEFDQDVAKNIQALIKDIDFNDEDYGFELLKRSLAINKAVALWWD
jgi:methyl coenzyme M reductase alpha subunit